MNQKVIQIKIDLNDFTKSVDIYNKEVSEYKNIPAGQRQVRERELEDQYVLLQKLKNRIEKACRETVGVPPQMTNTFTSLSSKMESLHKQYNNMRDERNSNNVRRSTVNNQSLYTNIENPLFAKSNKEPAKETTKVVNTVDAQQRMRANNVLHQYDNQISTIRNITSVVKENIVLADTAVDTIHQQDEQLDYGHKKLHEMNATVEEGRRINKRIQDREKKGERCPKIAFYVAIVLNVIAIIVLVSRSVDIKFVKNSYGIVTTAFAPYIRPYTREINPTPVNTINIDWSAYL